VHGVWSLEHPVATTLAMSAAILAVCTVVGVRRYNRVSR